MNKTVMFSLAATCLFAVLPVEAMAEKNTTMEVQLSKSQLSLEKVSSPAFGTQKLTGEAQILVAQEDLTITIEDGRAEKTSGWSVYYRLYAYQNSKDKENLAQAETKIGQGELRVNGELVGKEDYQAHPLSVKETNQTDQPLLQYHGSATADAITYIYTVTKENISLQLPKGTKAGSYSAQQMISLRDLPENN
ncbi:WxL domain-containing protein [Enterococcus sp. BWR-S5]|uniref:WxL domain-containing protein n=1 Tax=Enterococcus sp. BWR-S5 TaxID=2787714 RepID=UPI001924A371|nr:WxL domain-containing protein [Enterococcus sp. BWR-S5]MBL1224239.1 WxL domain-containing protein [Enterococcus sp. BWR-S5]